MSAPDTISQAVNSIASMNEMEYVYLLFKLGGIAVGIIISGGTAIGTLYVFGKWVWGHLLKSIKSSLSGTFCSPQDMEECKVEQETQLKTAIDELRALVVNGFAQGRTRMDQLDNGIKDLAAGQRHTTRRVDQLFVAVANESVPSEPPADSSVFDRPVFELPEGACSDDHA